MMVPRSRRGSVQIMQGSAVSTLPQVEQMRTFSTASPMARRQRRQQLLLLLDQMERGAAGRTRPEPRHLGQELDQALDFGTGDSLGHDMGLRLLHAARKPESVFGRHDAAAFNMLARPSCV